MNLLILTPFFTPLISPRAHRWTALARYWASKGHTVHVVTSRRPGEPVELHEGNLHVYRTGYASLHELALGVVGRTRARGRVGAVPRPPSAIQSALEWAYRNLWQSIYFPDDALVWQRPAYVKACELLQKHAVDRLITVSLPFSSHLVGYRLKQRFPDLFWLADIGDPFALQVQPLNRWSARSLRWEKTVLESADAAVVTTEATRELYARTFGDASVARMRVAPPLLDPPWNEQSTAPLNDGVLRLGYFGAFYDGVREPARLFALYDALQKQNRRFELHWYGDVPPKAWPELAKRPGMVVHGLQSRADVRKAMMRMDVLVNIGNVTTWQLPSKAAEYYASGKPVLHVAQTANDAFERFFKGASRLYVLHYRMDRVEGDLPELFITESNVDATFLETASVWQWYQNG